MSINTFKQGVYNYMPKTNHISSLYNIVRSLWLQFMIRVTLLPMINVLYFIIFIIHPHHYYYYYYNWYIKDEYPRKYKSNTNIYFTYFIQALESLIRRGLLELWRRPGRRAQVTSYFFYIKGLKQILRMI
jgi:hypothetical protein